jgi:hypothetical protein
MRGDVTDEPQDPDKPIAPSPDDPIDMIVESLLKYEPGSPEFEDAFEVAGPAERAEALRQALQAREWAREAQFRERRRELGELVDDD